MLLTSGIHGGIHAGKTLLHRLRTYVILLLSRFLFVFLFFSLLVVDLFRRSRCSVIARNQQTRDLFGPFQNNNILIRRENAGVRRDGGPTENPINRGLVWPKRYVPVYAHSALGYRVIHARANARKNGLPITSGP